MKGGKPPPHVLNKSLATLFGNYARELSAMHQRLGSIRMRQLSLRQRLRTEGARTCGAAPRERHNPLARPEPPEAAAKPRPLLRALQANAYAQPPASTWPMSPFRHAASALSVSAAAALASSCGTGLSRTWASRSRFRARSGRRPGAPRRRTALRLPWLRDPLLW